VKRFLFTLLIVVLGVSICLPARAIYGVKMSDLHRTPVPTNPVRVWGHVMSEIPLRISDGGGEIEVTGVTAKPGDLLVLDGNWDGSKLSVIGAPRAFVGPACIEMVYIAPGSFLMGNNGSEPNPNLNELPRHSVTLSAYWIGRYEVTHGQYRQFMEAGGYSHSSFWSTDGWTWKTNASRVQPTYWSASQNWGPTPGPFTLTDNHPVCGVTYYEAEAFCKWAGGRLPTEAQWEKAARWSPVAGRANVYPWGDSWDPAKCNCSGDTLYPGYQVAAVGSYPAGAGCYGCMDMAGNVREWCRDWYSTDYYSQTPAGGWVDPTGPSGGGLSYRSIRGGSYMTGDDSNRCAYRWELREPTEAFACDGFRFAR